MYRYAKLAKEQDIAFEYFGSIQECTMQSMDLCVLLGNALDNALAGCMTISQGRRIKVVMQSEERMVSIVVHNTFDGQVCQADEVILSRKRDNEPGIGTGSMRAVCDKYGAGIPPCLWP